MLFSFLLLPYRMNNGNGTFTNDNMGYFQLKSMTSKWNYLYKNNPTSKKQNWIYLRRHLCCVTFTRSQKRTWWKYSVVQGIPHYLGNSYRNDEPLTILFLVLILNWWSRCTTGRKNQRKCPWLHEQTRQQNVHIQKIEMKFTVLCHRFDKNYVMAWANNRKLIHNSNNIHLCYVL